MPDPAWHLLPHQPQQFFELADGFDRKQLKQSYNRLLKIYKPEKFPAEFQRIRAAYESLDQQLRYGEAGKLPANPLPPTWASLDLKTEKTRSPEFPVEPLAPSEPTPATIPWHERVRTEAPDELLRELQSLPNKQSVHYYALAIIADSRAGGSPTVMLNWILKGLEQWPQDAGLRALLSLILRTEIEPSAAASVLGLVAKVVRDDRFYFLTEGLWDRYLRAVPFAEFARTLQACESQLKDYRAEGRFAFYLHILKPAIWLADSNWLNATMAWLESESMGRTGTWEGELELLQMLREYHHRRSEKQLEDPIRSQMDEVIRSYCLDPEPEFDLAYLACAVHLGSGSPDVVHAFPVDPWRTDFDEMYRIWTWLDHEVGIRHGVNNEMTEPAKLIKPARALFRRIQEFTDRSLMGSAWTAFGLIFMLLKGMAYLGSLYLFMSAASAYVKWAALTKDSEWPYFLTAFGGGLAFGRLLCQALITPQCHRFFRYWARGCYHSMWRKELLPFLKQTRLPYEDFLAVLQQAEHDGIHCSGWICYYSRNDYGLALVALSQRYIV